MEKIPTHVAFIMDGNRRAGRQFFGGALEGHQKAMPVFEKIGRACLEYGISYATFYAFSTENWKRDEEEVQNLFQLFRIAFNDNLESLMKEGIKITFIGRRDRLPADILDMMKSIEERSKDNSNAYLQMALDYGGRDEITRAYKKLFTERMSADVKEEDISNALDTAHVPDPDIIIRTGGEHRLSGFLLWQSQYAEIYFTETLWPLFTKEEFADILKWFSQRERRHGA